MPRIERDDLTGRTGAIWQATLNGETQAAIAERFGISQQRVSRILADVRESMPEVDRADLIRREVEFLDKHRAEVLALWQANPIPAYSNGKPILMADGETVAEDHSGRLAGLKMAVDLHTRLSKLLGLDAPAKADVNVVGLEREAAAEAAEAAAVFLAGDDGDPTG